jgi:hypothetical protein
MNKIENKDLKPLHKEFKNLTTYIEKLKFFDTYFGITPFQFPSFQVDLDLIFEGENGKILMQIFETERYKKNKDNSYYLRCFIYFGKEYIFNITPTNSLRELYNEFILNKFIHEDTNYNDKINIIKFNLSEEREQMNTIFNDENINIKKLQKHVFEFPQKSTIKNQFLNVYYTGFSDYNNGLIKSFPNKKKHIELYLYAQGILQAKYFEEIKKCIPILDIVNL